jgi:type II secretory pathway component PulF
VPRPADAPAEPAGPGIVARLFAPVTERQLGLIYKQLAIMFSAGVAVDRSIDVATRNLRDPQAAAMFQQVRRGIQAGDALHECLARFPQAFRPLDVQLVRAGEMSGSLPEVLRQLAQRCETNVAERRAMVGELIRPVLTLHALFLLAPVPDLFLGTIGLGGYMLRAFGPLAPLYALVVGGWVAGRLGSFSAAWRRHGFLLLHAVPVLGGAVRKLGIARLAVALRALYEAGIGLQESLPLAGEASGNDVLAAACRDAARSIAEESPTLYEALAATGAFPQNTLLLIATGEESGQLDVTLDKIAQTHGDEARHTIRMLNRLFGLAVYLAVALMVAIRVIRFWSGYIDMVKSGGGL